MLCGPCNWAMPKKRVVMPHHSSLKGSWWRDVMTVANLQWHQDKVGSAWGRPDGGKMGEQVLGVEGAEVDFGAGEEPKLIHIETGIKFD